MNAREALKVALVEQVLDGTGRHLYTHSAEFKATVDVLAVFMGEYVNSAAEQSRLAMKMIEETARDLATRPGPEAWW